MLVRSSPVRVEPASYLNKILAFLLPVSLHVRFKISHCITLMLVLSLLMALVANHFTSTRQVRLLRDALRESRSILHTVEYGAANLRLIELNPAVWEDRDCSRFLKHELAICILDHWRDKDAIDRLVGTPGYSLEFAANALAFFECKSAADFVDLTKAELWVYPDDELLHSIYELSHSELASFDDFIRTATTPEL